MTNFRNISSILNSEHRGTLENIIVNLGGVVQKYSMINR